MKMKKVHIIAGPNGAGKTTFAREFLPNYTKCLNFINADLIAQGLSPFSPQQAAIKAGKLVLQQIREFSDRGVDFGFETTLAGKTYLRVFHDLKEKGYKLHLFFLWIPSPQLAIARVKDRVEQGGHDVPVEDIKRRFERSLINFFKIYQSMLNSWLLFDNSGREPKLIVEKNNLCIKVYNECLFKRILDKTGVSL